MTDFWLTSEENKVGFSIISVTQEVEIYICDLTLPKELHFNFLNGFNIF